MKEGKELRKGRMRKETKGGMNMGKEKWKEKWKEGGRGEEG